MILGRTPEGLIKIKKDEPLGLRAVNCACCGGGGCECGIVLPQSLRPLAANATAESFSINGIYQPGQFRVTGYGWVSFADFSEPGMAGYDAIYIFDRCFIFRFFDGTGVTSAAKGEAGSPLDCKDPPESSTVSGKFTINGIPGFDYYYYTGFGNDGLPWRPLPPPIVIF